ncbi:MAG: nuclear transport factor 2 family protein [Kofleriaceae bacterium]
MLGPRKADALTTRSDALVALSKYIDPKSKDRVTVQSSSLEIVAAPGGRSAWGYDVVTVDGEPMVAMMILANDDDLWSVTTVSLARTPSMKQIRSELKKVAVVPPAAKAPSKVDSRASDAVERFQDGLLDQGSWGDDLASSADAVAIGPAAGDITHGKKDLKKLWKIRTDANTRAAISGEITAAITPDGQLAWVTAPVTRVENDEDPVPLRVFAVFEKDDDKWKMIALQESVALDEPGAGASFVKILPPAPKPPEPPPAAEESQTQTKAKKSKKKKKKKKKKKAKVEIIDEE